MLGWFTRTYTFTFSSATAPLGLALRPVVGAVVCVAGGDALPLLRVLLLGHLRW